MSSLIKNQVLKHLTKFFKDLAPEQLQMNALMGSCELSNLQLNEVVLMNLLDLPVWLKITSAAVDKIHIKISWTKIKSVPIQMLLNEVKVQVEVCDEFRNIEGEKTDLSQYINTNPGKYGFVDRVIDGITVIVNNVNVSFNSKLMAAKFELSRVTLESRCPNWKPGELSLTRLKDVNRGQILLFKVAEWHTMRLEAKCLTNPEQAPLRLITNYAQCRLTIKKKLDDCSVVAARIFVIFEDILWILTFAQFISASAFVEYIFTLIKRSPMTKKKDTLGNESNFSSSSHNSVSQTPLTSPTHTPGKQIDRMPMLTGNMSSASLLEQKFRCYDIIETSLHLYIEKIDAHLFDDIEPQNKSRHETGGAIQLTLSKIELDCYPYSSANSDRKHWYKWFDPSPSTRKQWFDSHFSQFDSLRLKKTTSSGAKLIQKPSAASDSQLLSLSVLFKIKDFCLDCVTTNSSNSKGAIINKFIQIDKDYKMPGDMPSFYLELDYFYYYDAALQMMVYDDVPDPVTFIHLSPTKLLFDSPTLLFFNSFYANLTKALSKLNDLFPQDTTPPKIHIRIEILMPQLSLPAKSRDKLGSKSSKLLIKSGKITLSNSLYDKNVLQRLKHTIEQLNESSAACLNLIPKGNIEQKSSVWDQSILEQVQSGLCPTKQLWAFQFEPFWLDFMNHDSNELLNINKLQPIVEPVKAYIFIHIDLRSLVQASKDDLSNSKRDIISILVTLIDEPILANLDKTEFRFLQKFFAHLDKFLQQMKSDISNIIQLEHVTDDTLELHLVTYIKQIRSKVLFDKDMVRSGISDDAGDDEVIGNIENCKRPLGENSLPNSIKSAELHFKPNLERSETDTISFKETLYQPPQVLNVHDGSALIEFADEIDECAEVADDASCLFFDDQIKKENLGDQVEGDNLLEKIEECSKLFAKVNLPSTKPAKAVEIDPSSYLEFELSRLIVKTNALTSSSSSSISSSSSVNQNTEKDCTSLHKINMVDELESLRKENEALKDMIKSMQKS